MDHKRCLTSARCDSIELLETTKPNERYHYKNCLVLGGAGFLGSHLVEALLAHGHRVRVFDRMNADNRNLACVLPHIEFINGNFQDESIIDRTLTGIDVVYHLISTTIPGNSNENPVYDIESNIAGTVKWLTAARNIGVKKIIFVSSGGTVYGTPSIIPTSENHPTNPLCSYGITKIAIEKYLQLFHHLWDLEYSVLRVANMYGERQNPMGGLGIITTFLWKSLNNEPITIWGDGKIARDYIHVSDVVTALLSVIDKSSPSKIYNIGSGKSHTILDLIEMIKNISEISNPRIIFKEGRSLDVPINCLDISLARQEIDWHPRVKLETGIKRTLAWFKKISA